MSGNINSGRKRIEIPQTDYEAIKSAWGDYMQKLGEKRGGWDWWVTLTFREPPKDVPGWDKVGWGYSGRAWHNFINELGLMKGMHDIEWVYGREYQKWRGVPHFHGLVGGVAALRRDEIWKWWFDKYGMARILPYDKELGAGYYMCKYVIKDLGDIQFSRGLGL